MRTSVIAAIGLAVASAATAQAMPLSTLKTVGDSLAFTEAVHCWDDCGYGGGYRGGYGGGSYRYGGGYGGGQRYYRSYQSYDRPRYRSYSGYSNYRSYGGGYGYGNGYAPRARYYIGSSVYGY